MRPPTRREWGNPYDHSEYSRTTWTAVTWRSGYSHPADPRFACDWCGTVKSRLYSYNGDERHKFCDQSCCESYKE